MTPKRGVVPIVGAALVAVGACASAPNPHALPTPAVFQISAPLIGSAMAAVTITDTSGMIAGVTSVEPTGFDTNSRAYAVLSGGGSLPVLVVWNNGVCSRSPQVAVRGTAQALAITVDGGTPGPSGGCDALGAWIALRLQLAAPIDIHNIFVDGSGT